MIVAKTFDGREAELFAIPLEPARAADPPGDRPSGSARFPASPSPPPGPTSRPTAGGWRSARYDVVGVYRRRRAADDWKLLAPSRSGPSDQIEAIAWDGDDLILAGEGRGVYPDRRPPPGAAVAVRPRPNSKAP